MLADFDPKYLQHSRPFSCREVSRHTRGSSPRSATQSATFPFSAVSSKIVRMFAHSLDLRAWRRYRLQTLALTLEPRVLATKAFKIARCFEILMARSPSRTRTDSCGSSLRSAFKFLVPLERPFGLPDCPFLNRECPGGLP